MKKFIVVMVMVGMLASLAQAGISGQNIVLPRDTTVLTDGDPAVWYAQSGYVNGQWRDRSLDVASPWAGVPDVLPQTFLAQSTYGQEARTTITGLTAGQEYDVWVLSSILITRSTGAANGDSSIMAGFVSGQLERYNTGNMANTGLMSRAESTSDYIVHEGLLGTIVADLNGNIDVYVDYARNPNAHRSAYNGLAYSPVPEPATLALLGLGALVLRRKRK